MTWNIDLDGFSESLNNKADLDGNNIDDTFKDTISGLGMPSDRYINLELGASGSSYTAPANGWYSIQKLSGVTTSTLYLLIRNVSKSLQMAVNNGSATTSNGMGLFMPAMKGDEIQVYYTITGATNYFRFTYAEGAQ